jgi:hypothetical protein
MNDIDQSKLEKEAFRYALAVNQEHNLSVIEDCWAACAMWMMSQLEQQNPDPDCLRALGKCCGFEED